MPTLRRPRYDARLIVRVSLKTKRSIERAARRGGFTVGEYLRILLNTVAQNG